MANWQPHGNLTNFVPMGSSSRRKMLYYYILVANHEMMRRMLTLGLSDAHMNLTLMSPLLRRQGVILPTRCLRFLLCLLRLPTSMRRRS